ncbi:MAG: hypothetical protein KF760_04630 [Candidatus Eremiobacteraeota bacterium]|nr:hypothetical protein [Candidatus Eremiobacteraeota bacterium]MCW5866959.1 hypothetical protein [Candidatus Eremiobacteraeota bacterium]
MDSPFRARRLPQDRETAPVWEESAGLRWRYAFARAAETRANNEMGQDCVVLAPAPEGFSFCVTDGVSQSFFGDIAAAALADGLVQWLSELEPGAEVEVVRASLETRLRELCAEVSEDVRDQPLPAELPEMLRQVLEQKRLIGSESMYACGRIWRPAPGHPHGQLVLSWLGDVRCRSWWAGQEWKLEGFRTEDRWSSGRGILGSPGLFVSSLDSPQGRLSRLAVYSDGLEILDGLAQLPDNQSLGRAIADLARNPKSDDVSLVEVELTD